VIRSTKALATKRTALVVGSSAGVQTGQGIFQQASMTDAIFASAGDFFELFCYSANNTEDIGQCFPADGQVYRPAILRPVGFG
jgi:hypothetical protein